MIDPGQAVWTRPVDNSKPWALLGHVESLDLNVDTSRDEGQTLRSWHTSTTTSFTVRATSFTPEVIELLFDGVYIDGELCIPPDHREPPFPDPEEYP